MKKAKVSWVRSRGKVRPALFAPSRLVVQEALIPAFTRGTPWLQAKEKALTMDECLTDFSNLYHHR